MRCKRCKYYTQLMLLVGTMTMATPLSSHELGHGAQDTGSTIYAMWHNAVHAVHSCASQFSAGYLVFLVSLLAVLAYIAFRVKRSDRVLPT
ncbi:hypothetical protein [Kaarinaea lacus]